MPTLHTLSLNEPLFDFFPYANDKVDDDDKDQKNNCDESGGGTNNAGCTTEKSLDIGQITIGTGHTSLNP
jgi:hypothetical protein